MEYRIFQLKQQILADLKFDWTIKKMAEFCNLSKEHFHKIFKKVSDEPPIHYVRRKRLEKAKELLETTNLRVKEIMAEVGIHDQTHFNRDFKKAYGYAPNEYRQKYWDDIQKKNGNG